ncbi:MAG: hypothetical protein AB3N06_01650 [Erythrobacter sp.]
MKVFKFNRFGLLVLCAVLAYIPVEAIYQFIANGGVDWWRLGQGRIKLPFWLAFGFVLPVFLYTLFFLGVPAITAILRGYEFKLDGDILIVSGHPIPRHTIQSVRKSRLGGLLLRTTHGKLFRFQPDLSSGGTKAFNKWAGDLASELA